jgi:hypothetical protein
VAAACHCRRPASEGWQPGGQGERAPVRAVPCGCAQGVGRPPRRTHHLGRGVDVHGPDAGAQAAHLRLTAGEGGGGAGAGWGRRGEAGPQSGASAAGPLCGSSRPATAATRTHPWPNTAQRCLAPLALLLLLLPRPWPPALSCAPRWLPFPPSPRLRPHPRSRMAMTTSSRLALPARSPMPLMVHSTCTGAARGAQRHPWAGHGAPRHPPGGVGEWRLQAAGRIALAAAPGAERTARGAALPACPSQGPGPAQPPHPFQCACGPTCSPSTPSPSTRPPTCRAPAMAPASELAVARPRSF